MDPKEKEKMAEELNVEETKDTAEEQPQNDQAEEAAPLTHEEQLEKELEDAQAVIEESRRTNTCACLPSLTITANVP